MKKIKLFINILSLVSVFSMFSACAMPYTISRDPSNKEYILLIPEKETRSSPKIKFSLDPDSGPDFNLILDKKIDLNLADDLKKKNLKRGIGGFCEITDPSVVKELFGKLIIAKNGIKGAYERQEKRANGERRYRYVSQKLTNLVPMFKLPTPFGEVELDFAHGEGGNCYDILAYTGSYETICREIDQIVKQDKLPELAKIIDGYLRMPYDQSYTCEDFGGILNQMRSRVEKSDFFDSTENLNEGVTSSKKAKKYAAVLCAALFIAEPGPNRAFDGGKSSRAALKNIINDGENFVKAFAGSSPTFYYGVAGGAKTVRDRRKGNIVPSLASGHISLEENFSDDSDDESSPIEDPFLEERRTELIDKFKKLVLQAENKDELDKINGKLEELSKKAL